MCVWSTHILVRKPMQYFRKTIQNVINFRSYFYKGPNGYRQKPNHYVSQPNHFVTTSVCDTTHSVLLGGGTPGLVPVAGETQLTPVLLTCAHAEALWGKRQLSIDIFPSHLVDYVCCVHIIIYLYNYDFCVAGNK